MIFSELYGSYYNAVAEILKTAVSADGAVQPEDLRGIIARHAFGESLLAIEPAIAEERWQICKPDGSTKLTHAPTMPLTLLQKRWLKAISLDPRIQLFEADFGFLEDVEPLFTLEDYCVFDKYADGDDFSNPTYIANFRLIFSALKARQPLRIGITNRKGGTTGLCVMPEYLEYSEKDDKFRLITSGGRYPSTVNLGRIVYCRPFHGAFMRHDGRRRDTARTVVLTVHDVRNALERVLLHFSHFEKEAERTDEDHYKITIKYDQEDETELLIRILSFGPMVKVMEPYRFVNLIKERLTLQMSCGKI